MSQGHRHSKHDAEHEFARLENRRRFDEQMLLLDLNQSRDNASTNEMILHSSGESPMTPAKTPVQSGARSRASTMSKGTPMNRQSEARTSNEQLVTPPSESRKGLDSVSSATDYSDLKSRRASATLAFETLTMTDSENHSHLKDFYRPNPRLDQSNVDKPYLEMNTTDDSFPILVRKATHINPGALSTPDYRSDIRRTSLSSLPQYPIQVSSRAGTDNTNFGMQDQARKQIQTQAQTQIQTQLQVKGDLPSTFYYDSDQQKRHLLINDMVTSRSPLGNLPTISSKLHATLQPSSSYVSYVGNQPEYQPHAFASFPLYGMNTAQSSAVNENRLKNQSSYGVHRPGSFLKRPTEEVNRYADIALDSLIGDIYALCKDQHGCRYLQKKLDERNVINTEIIFSETCMHAAELMIDPFGNYLCQKLFEHCNDDQRLQIVQNVASDLVNISLNMHGTRAVQKMIEHLTTGSQIKLATDSLALNCVTLVKDLNGNHVIQRCLNRLGSQDNQFIFDTVSKYCVEVATHRHGCCVLQRCVDHASEPQKSQIITEIIRHASLLIQDPFGNYVVQYVLDLGDIRFSDPLIKRFAGSVCLFSVQKFSSNVIEKCLRVAEPATRALLISELLHKARLERLLRDSYANYVIQTALDYAELEQRHELVNCIRPFLPAIRSTPYGRRIQSKISGGLASGSLGANLDCSVQTASITNFSGYKFGQTLSASHGLSNMHSSFLSDYE